MAAEHYDPWTDKKLLGEVLDKYESKGSIFTSSALSFRWAIKRGTWKVVVGSTHVLKRSLDVFVSLVAILLFAPVFLLTWIAIKIDDPGPAIFIQHRVGKRGKTFSMFKFRSMIMNADKLRDELLAQNESEGGVTFKMKDDPRITKVGKFIRKFSIDELPQLFNVLKGNMSLVGPRPHPPADVESYSLADRRRLEVTPGITCLWQIGGRSDTSFEDVVRLDVQYIQEQSFLSDLIILLKTIPVVLLGKGAY